MQMLSGHIKQMNFWSNRIVFWSTLLFLGIYSTETFINIYQNSCTRLSVALLKIYVGSGNGILYSNANEHTIIICQKETDLLT